MLFNEPKLPKFIVRPDLLDRAIRFSALQRAEIAEIPQRMSTMRQLDLFQCSSTSRNCRNLLHVISRARSSLFQCSSTSRNCRNNIALESQKRHMSSFSALQRAEIAEIHRHRCTVRASPNVSVLFNEPKLPKFFPLLNVRFMRRQFQCSSTSRNCRNKYSSLCNVARD